MKFLRFLFFVYISCFIHQQVFSQTDIDKTIDNYVKASLSKSPTTEFLKTIFATDPLDVLYAATRYTSDSISEVRMEVYRLLGLVGLKTSKANVRARYVKQLVLGFKDNDSGITGIVLDFLTDFLPIDFDSEARYELTAMLNTKVPYYDKVVKLIGYIGIAECVDNMHRMLTEKQYPSNNVRWALHLALARMGDTTEVDYCVKKVKATQLSDNLVYEVFPDLAYIRHKQAFDYLFSIIESNKMDCSSSNPDSDAKIICAYRIIQIIAPYIENFPLVKDASGDIKWGNANADLIKVRSWIVAHRNSYKLITAKY